MTQPENTGAVLGFTGRIVRVTGVVGKHHVTVLILLSVHLKLPYI